MSNTTSATADIPNRKLRTREAARYLGISPGLLIRLRASGSGPAFTRPTGQRVVTYDVHDLEAWYQRQGKQTGHAHNAR